MLTIVAMITAAGLQSGRVKWVPLQSPPAKYEKPQATQTAESPSPTSPDVTHDPVSPAPSAVQAPAVQRAASEQLNLTCFGGGTANKATVTTVNSNAYVSGNVGFTPYSGSASGSSTAVSRRQQAFGDQVDVRLFGGDDRIRMPRTMLPAIRGGKDGWFKLKDVVADARSIRAKAAVNFINSPNVFIDRVTGTISISGKAGDYSGQCQAIAADAPAKF